MKYFFDTYALIEIAEGNPAFQKYSEAEGITLKDNLAELYYSLIKRYSEKAADLSLNKFFRLAADLSLPVISKAMLFRFKHEKKRFSYIDCLGYIYALENKLLFVTGDKEFKGMMSVEFVR